MDYHPKQMAPSAIFLATKTENNHIFLRKFAEKLPNTTEQEVVAPEFRLIQGLRFTFDVRHPQRGLEGAYMVLRDIAAGKYMGPGKDAMEVRVKLEQLPARAGESARGILTRINTDHTGCKEILKSEALLSDAYLLFTPPQIWLAAMFLVDEPLALFYLETVLALDSNKNREQIEQCIRSCADMLAPKPAEVKGEIPRIVRKLKECSNPDNIDLVGLSAAHKRDGGPMTDEEKAAKKRKLDAQNSAKEDDPFGPALS